MNNSLVSSQPNYSPMHVKLFILVLLAWANTAAFAQTGQYQFSHLDVGNGLSNNQVNCIYKDGKGFMWFGTMFGLNRYDGYNFKVFKHDPANPNSVIDNYIVDIFDGPDKKIWINTRSGFCVYDPVTECFGAIAPQLQKLFKIPYFNLLKMKHDSHDGYWFITTDAGIYYYNAVTRQTHHYVRQPEKLLSLYSNTVMDLAEDSAGGLWVVYSDGVIEKLDPRLNKITFHSDLLSKANFHKTENYSVTIDQDDDLWFFAINSAIGTFYFNPRKGIFNHIDKDNPTVRLNSDLINNIIQDDEGLIWIGTDHGGINLIDKHNGFKVSYILSREDDVKSLRQNTVKLYKDNTGIIWAGTFKEGISYYHKNIIKFPIYRHFASDPLSLSYEDVDVFAEDKAGNLWIGTNGGGLIYFNRKNGKFKQYKHNAQDNNSLSNDVIVALCIDHEQKLWIGTYFGGMDCYDGKTFKHYRYNDKVPFSLSDDRVWNIIEDASNRLWIGTFAGGVNVFDASRSKITHPYSYKVIPSTYVSTLLEDRDKNIWVGGYLGVDEIKHNGETRHLSTNVKDVNSLISNNVNCIIQDSRGLYWIGTRDGLSIFNSQTNQFTSLHKLDGLPDDVILNVLEDDHQTLWLSTANGLCNVLVSADNGKYRFRFKNYDEKDGLQSREFNVNAALKTQEGELVFGGPHGFNLFNPSKISSNEHKPTLIFTGFDLFNKSIEANELVNGHPILSRSISETKSIVLNHDENVFTIEFAALDFFDPNKVKHQYMMQGFDHDWLTADNAVRKATYTNLDAGEYTFKVRASNTGNFDQASYITLKIEVKPPFWKTTLAYVIYLLAILSLLFYIRRRGMHKLKMEFALEQEKLENKRVLEQERQEVKRMHELDLMKIKFLTNVSHEFRTPLSLIMAPVDKMLKQTEDAGQRQQINMIKVNARRLLNLVNQLLDFRKMEVQELKLHTKQGDIIAFIKEISTSFTDIADKKHIGFLFDSEVEQLETYFDHDKIERILFNLLSNAFKFTSRGGHVSVLLNLLDEKSTAESKMLEIKVIDTGIGVPREMHSKIFERFFQNDVPGSLLNQGSGIGLSITREFVKMHQGDIFIESELNQGSCFIIQLPLQVDEVASGDLVTADNHPASSIAAEKNASKEVSKAKKLTVLIVEDNEDFRFYLKDNLKDIFNILEAPNGKEGWQKALSSHPDIMVSDISMPEMNGIELCKKIKGDERTSHIPVILLTALTGEEDQVKGLEIGANDYMTKPFNFEILLSKIKNLLTLQEQFKKTYRKQMHVQLEDIVVESVDEKFLHNAVDYIQKNILNPSLSVEELSKQMNMSRVSLYKKILSLTGKSPVEFIRSIRLQKAMQLLEKSQLNITGVCYEVGFNNPTYFAKIFKEEYNMLPSEYVSMIRKKEQNPK